MLIFTWASLGLRCLAAKWEQFIAAWLIAQLCCEVQEHCNSALEITACPTSELIINQLVNSLCVACLLCTRHCARCQKFGCEPDRPCLVGIDHLVGETDEKISKDTKKYITAACAGESGGGGERRRVCPAVIDNI